MISFWLRYYSCPNHRFIHLLCALLCVGLLIITLSYIIVFLYIEINVCPSYGFTFLHMMTDLGLCLTFYGYISYTSMNMIIATNTYVTFI